MCFCFFSHSFTIVYQLVGIRPWIFDTVIQCGYHLVFKELEWLKERNQTLTSGGGVDI
jgi:hypothetical protein